MLSRGKTIGAVAILAALALSGLLLSILPRSGDPDALWKIVHDRCVPGQTSRNDPAPCVTVNLAERWALYKDESGNTQFLLIPTDRVTGIEDPAILAGGAPNYWEVAWHARGLVDERAGEKLTIDQIALAINSSRSRSQNQLHIHIDCIRSNVRDELRRVQAQIGTTWIRTTISGQEYEIRWLSANDLHRGNLFALVADHLRPDQTMAAETIVLVGAILPDGSSGFDLIVGRAGVGGNRGGGEVLEDHGCAIAKVP
jgi:CDP-diacylglycerol pyrophosphatase